MTSWLTFFKYAGLVIAATSALLGTVTDVTKDVNGTKRLTRAGWISVTITAVSFLVGIGSTALEDRRKLKEGQDALQAEIERTNRIIVSGQLLTSLQFRWEFQALDPELLALARGSEDRLRAYHENHQGFLGSTEGGEVNRIYVLYPFLLGYSRQLAGSKKTASESTLRSGQVLDPIVLLIGLDESHNSVLPFGVIPPEVNWLRGTPRPEFDPGSLSGGILLCQRLDRPCSDAKYWSVARSITSPPGGYLDERASPAAFVVDWVLDGLTLAHSIDRQNSYVFTSARLPSTLKIAIFFDIHQLPFESTNFALPRLESLWDSDVHSQDVPVKGQSRIRVIANNMAEATYNYSLKRIVEPELVDDEGAIPIDSRCLVFEFELEDRAQSVTRN
jgi:hypothetical protein